MEEAVSEAGRKAFRARERDKALIAKFRDEATVQAKAGSKAKVRE